MINQLKKSVPCVLLIFTLFLTGCSKRSQRIINDFNNRPNDFEQTKNDVTIGTKFLTHNEFNAFFKSPSFWVRKSSSKNYQAILLSIKNSGKNSYLIDSKSIKLDLISPEEMYELLKANAIARGIAGMLVYPILGLSIGVLLYITTAIIIGTPSAVFWILGAVSIPFIFLATGIYLGIKSYTDPTRKNHKLYKKILKQTADLEKEKILKTNESLNVMFFVKKKNLKNAFDITLSDPIAKETALEFNIPVPVAQLCS